MPVAFDFADREQGPVLDAAAPYVDYAFFSRREDSGELRDFLRAFRQRGPKVVVATLGEHGSLAWNGEAFIPCGAVRCPVVDTMGAGDSFIAGFLMAWLKKESIPACMRAGAENAAVTLGYPGAW